MSFQSRTGLLLIPISSNVEDAAPMTTLLEDSDTEIEVD